MTDFDFLEISEPGENSEEPFAREEDLILVDSGGERKLLPIVGISEIERIIFSREGDKRIEIPYDDAIVLKKGVMRGYCVGKNLRRGTFLAQFEDYDRVKVLYFKKEETKKPVSGEFKGNYSSWTLLGVFPRKTRKILKTLESGKFIIHKGLIITKQGDKRDIVYTVNEDETEFIEKALKSPALNDYLSRLESLAGQETEIEKLFPSEDDFFLRNTPPNQFKKINREYFLKEQPSVFVSFSSFRTPEDNFDMMVGLNKCRINIRRQSYFRIRGSRIYKDFLYLERLANLTLEPVK